MADLHRKPVGQWGHMHHITPQNAGWGYVGFDLHRLRAGDVVEHACGDTEIILVMVEGRATVTVDAQDFGEIGERLSVFERTPPHCIYAPNGSVITMTATTDCEIALCAAPGKGGHKAQRLGPDGIVTAERGQGTNLRYINNIAMEDRDVADSLLVTEVFTPDGHWSSYPPHRHDVDDYPNMTYLEETYYHRLNPAQGFGIQRVFTEDGTLDETMAVSERDLVLVPKGHHPCGSPYGYEMYYLNVMAGPLRKWRFKNHPDHDWIYQRDLAGQP